jgi:acyl-CoA thioesterase FadM
VRYLEEARVAWMRARDLSLTHYPKSDRVLALMHFQVWHFKPARFDDLVTVRLQVRAKGVKIHFQYDLSIGGERIAQAETLHIPVNSALKPMRPSPELLRRLEEEPWTETWLLNS